jgi:hypothetical protein
VIKDYKPRRNLTHKENYQVRYAHKKYSSKQIQYMINAKIVKIMKRNLKMKFKDLGLQVSKSFIKEFFVIVSVKKFKFNIKNLIEREFIKRNEVDGELFEYIA